MSFLSEEELKGRGGVSLAPMIDFLFLLLVFFASLAVSRITTRDTDIQLVEIAPEIGATASSTESRADFKIINISINENNEYKWVTDVRDYQMNNAGAIKEELIRQFEKGLLPADIAQTQVLLKIDKNAKWEPILQAIFAIREAGFDVRPLYEPDEENVAEGVLKQKSKSI